MKRFIVRMLFSATAAFLFTSATERIQAQEFDLFGDSPSAAAAAPATPAKPSAKPEPKSEKAKESPAEVLMTAPDQVKSKPKVSSELSALNSLYVNQWVKTDASGAFRGSVVSLMGQDTYPVPGAKVTLTQQGKVAMTVRSDSTGSFTFNSVPSGYYSIIADSDNSFAAFGIAVVAQDLGKHLPNEIEVRVIRPKAPTVIEVLRRDLVPSFSETKADIVLRDPLAPTRSASTTHRIAASKDGTVSGYLSKMGLAPGKVDMSSMKAYLLKDGKSIETVRVAKNGSFDFSSVPSGCYGLLATGSQGVAAVAFCVVDSNTVVKRKEGSKVFVSTQEEVAVASAALSSLNVELADGADVSSVPAPPAPPQEIVESVPVEEEEVVLASPMASTGFGGYPPGSGQIIGGGGGGSGLGNIGPILTDLAGLGLAAYGISELSGNNDDNVVSPVVR